MDASAGFTWGMFSPEHVPSTRRARTLGVGATVRYYNDRAVPGTGGLFYAMPLVWGLLGIALSEDSELRAGKRPVRPLAAANAVEALVMWLGLHARADMSRGAGQRKLANRDDASFAALLRPGAYVTQPLRMRTVQPLPELGFVEAVGPRFNYFRLSEGGYEILDHYTSEFSALKSWALGGATPENLRNLLPASPVKPEVRQILARQLFQQGQDGARRRRDLMRLGRDRATELGEMDQRPDGLGADHFADIRSGIAFIDLRDAALGVLDAAERFLRGSKNRQGAPQQCADAARDELAVLQKAASRMLGLSDSSDGAAAHAFARLCSHESPARVLHDLAERDGTVIVRQAPDRLWVGPVEAPDTRETAEDGEDSPPDFIPQLPRIANYFSLLEDISDAS